jgi:hypothetical protein
VPLPCAVRHHPHGRSQPAEGPRSRLEWLLGPEPNSILKATLIALVLVVGFRAWLYLPFHYLYPQTTGRSTATPHWDVAATIFVKIVFPALAETLVLALIAIPFRHLDKRYWFVGVVVLLAAIVHQPISIWRTVPIAIGFGVLALQFDIWAKRRSWTLAYAGTAWTHAVYNFSVVAIGWWRSLPA